MKRTWFDGTNGRLLVIVLQRRSLPTEISVWSKNFLLITDALLIKSIILDILMFQVKCP